MHISLKYVATDKSKTISGARFKLSTGEELYVMERGKSNVLFDAPDTYTIDWYDPICMVSSGGVYKRVTPDAIGDGYLQGAKLIDLSIAIDSNVPSAKEYELQVVKCCINGYEIPTCFMPCDEEPEVEMEKEDVVNHPQHYISDNGFETIDAIAGLTADKSGLEAFCVGNVIKYVSRYKKKNGLEDLKKAEWYLKRLIRTIEVEEAKKK